MILRLNPQFKEFFRDLGVPTLQNLIKRKSRYFNESKSHKMEKLISNSVTYLQQFIFNKHKSVYSELMENNKIIQTLKDMTVVVADEVVTRNKIIFLLVFFQ